MKEKLKRLLASLAAVIMAVGMMAGASVPVLAEGTHTITITSSETGHVYEAYQIFTGDYASGKLSNIQAGANLDLDNKHVGETTTASKLATELKTAFPSATGLKDLTDDATAAQIAEAIGQASLTNETDINKLAQILGEHLTTDATNVYPKTSTPHGTTGYEITGVSDGYYLIIDKSGTQGFSGTNTAYTRIILQVAGKDEEVTPKADHPTVEKKVYRKNPGDGITGENAGTWNDTATYGSANGAYGDLSGEEATYKSGTKNVFSFYLKGTLPSNFEYYATYKHYTFNDTLSKGITPTAPTDTDRGFKAFVYTDANGTKTIPTSTSDFTTDKGFTDITSLFTRTANTNDDGTQSIKFALNSSVDLKDSTTTGNVTFSKDSKIIIIYQATLNKDAVTTDDGNDNKVDLEYSNNPNNNQGGDYGKTPEDVVKVFTNKLRPNKYGDTTESALEGATFTLFESKTENGNTVADTSKAIATATSDDKGQLIFHPFTNSGSAAEDELLLANGTYVLRETTTPDGFDTMQDVVITISATLKDGDTPTISNRNVTVPTDRNDVKGFQFGTATVTTGGTSTTVNTGVINGNLINKSGSTLPNTGGIGTTIFYVIGGVLVAGAVILLISRKRRA